ncbi:MAG: DUF6625 family protein [Paludibacteraceae bacterium]
MLQKSIAILTCWYGIYPWYFPYFVHSCRFNPTVDFIIITDNDEIIHNKPENIILIHRSLDELKINFEKKLGFSVSIDFPYKLCDFKPAYGYLFPEVIKNYDFWVIGDVDVVYGDIRAFMTDLLLNEYDVISSRHDYITGSFCLFRNNEYINSLFMKSKDYKKVFTSSDNFCFDECNYQFKELAEGQSILELDNHIESMTLVVKREEKENKLKAFFDFIVIEGFPGRIMWSNGKIIYKNQYEAMLYHLVRFKSVCKYPIVLNPIPDSFRFTPTRIIK